MNKEKYYKILLISLLISVIGLQSCYRDKFDFSNLNDTAELSPHIGLPVAYGELSLRDLVKERKDTIEYYTEGQEVDTMIKLIYNIDTISQYKASEFLKPPVIEPVSKTVQLGVLTIDDQNSDTSITFNKFVTDNFLPADLTYYNSLGANANVASKNGSQYPAYNLNKFGGIAWVYTLTGDVIMTITNNYKVPLSCKILLQTDLSLVGEGTKTIGTFDFTTTPIPPLSTASDTISVNGYKISSLISYKFSNVTLGAKNPATISMNDKMFLTLQLANLQVTSGKAVIPSQSLKKDTTVWFALDTYKGKKLTRLDVHSGVLNFDITSKIPGLNITLSLPTVKKNGVKVSNTFAFTGAGKISKEWDLSGFSMDLSTNKTQPYNSLPVELKFAVNSNGQQVSFNQSNDFTVTISNKDSLQFEYVQGNLGHDTVNIGKKTFDYNIDQFLTNYFNGKVIFTDPKLSLNFTNSVGMSASTDLQLTGVTKEGKTLSLFDAGTLKRIDSAAVPGDTAYPKISITKDNSHIVDFISFLPHTMIADGIIRTNLGIPDSYYGNFITRESFISVQLNAELPLKFSMQDVVLRQEFPLSPSGSSSISELEEDDQFKIIFYAKNQFPVDVTVKLTLLDTNATNPVLDTLDITIIKAAATNATGKVERNVFSRHREEIILSKSKNPKLVSNYLKANKLRFEAKLNTYDKKAITIYTYYSIAFQLGVDAKVKYKTNLKKVFKK